MANRNDQERFYNHMSFYDYEDLKIQMKRYLYRANRIPMAVLGWLSPIDKRRELTIKFKPVEINQSSPKFGVKLKNVVTFR